MQIYWLRQFAFAEALYTDPSLHKHFGTITFASQPNIDAQIWLTIFSPGASWSGKAITNVGAAAAGIKSYRFVNDRGQPELKEMESWTSHVRVNRILELTVAFHVRLAWAKAEGNIYYWE